MRGKPVNSTKACKHCGKMFLPSCNAEKFCSNECMFHASYEKSDGCWNWMRNKDKQGYGIMRLKGRMRVKAHRFSCELVNGPNDSLIVMHSCDNPGCVNPAHLSYGTHYDNKIDSVKKDRHAFGSRVHWSKPTNDDVVKIRESSEPIPSIASEYDIHESTVYSIRRGATWKHVSGAGPATFTINSFTVQ